LCVDVCDGDQENKQTHQPPFFLLERILTRVALKDGVKENTDIAAVFLVENYGGKG